MAWVLMPDHAHWLLQLGAALKLPDVMRRLKSTTGRLVQAGAGRVWMAGYHERAIRDERAWRDAARYLVMNPVRAGLCETVWQYAFWDAEWVGREPGAVV